MITDNERKMSILGVGPKISAVALPVLAITIAIAMYFPHYFNFPKVLPTALLAEGLMLLIIGLIVNFTSASAMIKAVKEGKLLTTGYFSMCRNPMYASFIYLTIPGLALLLNSWLIILVSVVIFMAVNKFVVQEEIYLKEKFGAEYETYLAHVHRIIPFMKPGKSK